ncbi:MAG: hypothetical protein J3K34DRAFT_511183 [Monoraphidium minutum]|nr:MAG: hypothetical protein J3K34DRAFT_511183 [Monoraphidium minutum]
MVSWNWGTATSCGATGGWWSTRFTARSRHSFQPPRSTPRAALPARGPAAARPWRTRRMRCGMRRRASRLRRRACWCSRGGGRATRAARLTCGCPPTRRPSSTPAHTRRPHSWWGGPRLRCGGGGGGGERRRRRRLRGPDERGWQRLAGFVSARRWRPRARYGLHLGTPAACRLRCEEAPGARAVMHSFACCGPFLSVPVVTRLLQPNPSWSRGGGVQPLTWCARAWGGGHACMHACVGRRGWVAGEAGCNRPATHRAFADRRRPRSKTQPARAGGVHGRWAVGWYAGRCSAARRASIHSSHAKAEVRVVAGASLRAVGAPFGASGGIHAVCAEGNAPIRRWWWGQRGDGRHVWGRTAAVGGARFPESPERQPKALQCSDPRVPARAVHLSPPSGRGGAGA